MHLHSRGVLFHRYLNDLLIRAQSPDTCWHWTAYLLALLRQLGLGVNLEKSDLAPSQDFVYVGVRFKTSGGVLCPPPDQLEAMYGVCSQLLRDWVAPACRWLSLLGVLSSLEKLVPLGRVHIRPIHFCLRGQFAIGIHSLDRQVTLDRPAATALRWWLCPPNVEPGVPLGPFVLQVTLYTDSSTESWGAHAVGFRVGGNGHTWRETCPSIA